MAGPRRHDVDPGPTCRASTRKPCRFARTASPSPQSHCPPSSLPPIRSCTATQGVWHREHVYNAGPPIPHVSPEVLDLCDDLEAPALDFGCGAWALVTALRARAAWTRVASSWTSPSNANTSCRAWSPRSCSTMADFQRRARMAAFGAVTCCEVLQHMLDCEAAIAEITAAHPRSTARYRARYVRRAARTSPRGRAVAPDGGVTRELLYAAEAGRRVRPVFPRGGILPNLGTQMRPAAVLQQPHGPQPEVTATLAKNGVLKHT